MLGKTLENVRKKTPLIHNITNYVTVNDCANTLLACGGSPIMSDDCGEVEEITTICGGLNINIGTLNSSTIPAMFLAGKRANELSHPTILDPVGAGASTLRTSTAAKLIEQIHFSVIRGNISEIKTIAAGSGTTKGVDADEADAVTASTLDSSVAFAKQLALSLNSIIAITGKTDIVTDGKKAFIIENGNAMMSKITGTGCMLTAMICAYITANPDDMLTATAAAVCAMGIAGQEAYKRLTAKDGNASYRSFIIDEIYNLTPEKLDSLALYSIQD